jgi:hypothetical protein
VRFDAVTLVADWTGSALAVVLVATAFSVGAVELLDDGGACDGLAVSFFFMIGFAIAAVGFGFPTAVAAGPGPVMTLAIFGTMSIFGVPSTLVS